ELNARGVTVLLTTHYLEDAEQLCDRIAIINHGRVIACDTTAALLRRLDAKELSIIVDRDLTAVPAALGRFDVVLKDSRRLVVRYQPSRIRVAQILTAVHDAGLEIVDLSTLEADLEDIFLQLPRADVRGGAGGEALAPSPSPAFAGATPAAAGLRPEAATGGPAHRRAGF